MNYNIKYIDTAAKYSEMMHCLSDKKVIYIDLEFDKNHFRYGFNICLLQLYDGTTCFVIDPLANIELKSLFQLIEDPTVQKVCFAFNEDMRLLVHLGAQPHNIYDLSVAQRLLNTEPLSLTNSLIQFLSPDQYSESSSQQKSNWFLRPLSEKQITYAAEDVLFLPALKVEVSKKLQEEKREVWFAQEMDAFEKYDWSGSESSYLTQKDQKLLSRQEWVRFQEIMTYREELAKSIHRPSYKAIPRNTLFELAQTPSKIKNVDFFKGFHPKLKKKSVQEKFEKCLQQAANTIAKEKIKPSEKSIPIPSNAEKLSGNKRRKRNQEIKDYFFLPIKKEVIKNYGEHFGNFFLSNRKMIEYANKNMELLPYQNNMLLSIAQNLNLSVPDFIIQKNETK